MNAYPIIEVPIDAISTEETVRRESAGIDFESLVDSIHQLGLLEPIGVTEDYRLVFGSRRLRACQHLGWENLPAEVIPEHHRFQIQEAENRERVDFCLAEKVRLAEKIKASLGIQQGQRRDLEPTGPRNGNFGASGPEVTTPLRPRDIAAKGAGLGSEKSLRRAEQVMASGNQALIDAVDCGTIALRTAAEFARLPPEELATLDLSDPDVVREQSRGLRQKPTTPKARHSSQPEPGAIKKLLAVLPGLDHKILREIVWEVNEEVERQFFRNLHGSQSDPMHLLTPSERALELTRTLNPLDGYAFLEACLKRMKRKKYFREHDDDPLPDLLEQLLPVLHQRWEEEQQKAARAQAERDARWQRYQDAGQPGAAEAPPATDPQAVSNVIDFHTSAASG